MEKSFFKDFEPLSIADQRAKIHGDLGGKNAYDALVWNSPEGIAVHPLYPLNEAEKKRKDLKEISPWKITQYLTFERDKDCLLYTSPSPRDLSTSRMPSSA